jgi:hypothetical protein
MPPALEAGESSPTFHALGTVVAVQPSREVEAGSPSASPVSCGSSRNSHSPSRR